jgi:hypothetical protein
MTLNVHKLLLLTDYEQLLHIRRLKRLYCKADAWNTRSGNPTDIIAMLRIPSTMYTLHVDHNSDSNVIELYKELSDSVSPLYRHNDIIDNGIRVMDTITNRALTSNH